MTSSIYELKEPDDELLTEIALDMRADDINEVWATNRVLPFEALKLSVLGSRETYIGYAEDKAVCAFGIGTMSPFSLKASPWMLSTNAIHKYATPLLRGSKEYIESLSERFEELENYVDARNKRAIQWIKWMGFELHDPAPYGVDQIPFHKFTMSFG